MVKYATQLTEKSARAMAVSLSVSYKQSVEVCREIRGKHLERAMRIVKDVTSGKSIPFKRFNAGGTGHRPGMGPARSPVKTCKEFVKLLRNAQSNAEQKGLDASSLVVKAAVAKKGANQLHYGRRRRNMKRTHIEIIVEETEGAKRVSRVDGKSSVKKAKPAAKQSKPAAKHVAKTTTAPKEENKSSVKNLSTPEKVEAKPNEDKPSEIAPKESGNDAKEAKSATNVVEQKKEQPAPKESGSDEKKELSTSNSKEAKE